MRVLGLVPARGGSKGIPRKNVKLLRGKPLLAYTADSISRARGLARVILSTEDQEIAEVGRRYGLEVPFLRPSELARDETPMIQVVQHALDWFEAQSEHFDAVCVLQPTSPLRRPEDVDGATKMLESPDVDAVISVSLVPADFNPHWVYFLRADNTLQGVLGDGAPIPRRQSLPPAYCREGSIYAVKSAVVREQQSLYGTRFVGYVIDRERSVNINSPEDWARAERLLAASGGAQ